MKTSLGQYCINVTDLEKSVQFYENALGLKVQSRTDVSPTIKEVILGADDEGAHVQLAQHLDRAEPIDHGNAFWKLYVNTDDCEGLYRRAIEAGAVSVTEPRKLDRWPVTIAFILDPDGYNIELVQRDRN
jgi:lactoylglutathione lyase